MKLSNNTILITGGATGIGLGLTEQFLRENNKLIICGRRAGTLEEVAAKHPDVVTRVCDIASEQERTELFAWLAAEHPDLNVLVNNAGVQHWMNVTDDDFYARTKQEIAINIEAPLHLTQLFLRLPAARTVMNVSSGLAFSPFSKVPVYCATKAFLHSFTLSLRHLLKKNNVEVIEIIPPALNTDLGGKGLHDAYPPVGEFIASIFEQLRSGSNELTFGSSTTRAHASQDELKAFFTMMNPD